jgi:myo-inositol-1(or 4)-monophosphatase
LSPASGRVKSKAQSFRHIALNSIVDADGLVAPLAEAARTAGELALKFFRPGQRTSAEVSQKLGGSPVTEADVLVDQFLKQQLDDLLPGAGWLSEESSDSPARLSKSLVLIVDPIDGTRGFACGDPVWAIAVALVQNGRPVIGIVHAPALAQTYVALKDGGARLNGEIIKVSEVVALTPAAKVAAPVGLATELRRAGLEFELQPRIPSLAMRIALVASGHLDAGFAAENAHDWDIAAADLILQEAGGRLASLDGHAILYNRSSTRHGLLTAAPAQIHAEVNAAARRAREFSHPSRPLP